MTVQWPFQAAAVLLQNALEKQKNSQEQKATDLDNREKELDQIQDALAAKVEDMEKQETALKNLGTGNKRIPGESKAGTGKWAD